MFKLDPDAGYWRTVTFHIYAETGAPEEHQLRVKFRHLKRSQVRALLTPSESVEGQEPQPPITDEDVCRAVVLAIHYTGGDILVSLDEALDVPSLAEVLSTSYFNSLRELREKNLPAPPTTG